MPPPAPSSGSVVVLPLTDERVRVTVDWNEAIPPPLNLAVFPLTVELARLSVESPSM